MRLGGYRWPCSHLHTHNTAVSQPLDSSRYSSSTTELHLPPHRWILLAAPRVLLSLILRPSSHLHAHRDYTHALPVRGHKQVRREVFDKVAIRTREGRGHAGMKYYGDEGWGGGSKALLRQALGTDGTSKNNTRKLLTPPSAANRETAWRERISLRWKMLRESDIRQKKT